MKKNFKKIQTKFFELRTVPHTVYVLDAIVVFIGEEKQKLAPLKDITQKAPPLPTPSSSGTSGITCPICLESYDEIKNKKKQVFTNKFLINL